MATFLELVQAAARDSGTVSTWASLSTVSGQTGRLLRFVHWVREAYSRIQAEREDWRWLRADWSGSLLAGTATYDSAALGIASRFGRWIYDTDAGGDVTLYVTADGQATEGYLTFVPWDEFRRIHLVGSNATQTGTPTHYSVDPSDRLRVWPTPDAVCTMRGEYLKSAQTLEADADTPEMPAAHHEAIKFKALMLMATFDEAFEQHPYWLAEYAAHMAALTRQQTPRLEWGGPLA